ncbi:MAG TPA: hypothetical protein VF898_11660 [Chloroflexota bacterium]
MRKSAAVLGVLVLALWIFSASRAQQAVGPDDATVRAQLTAIVQPTSTPTP